MQMPNATPQGLAGLMQQRPQGQPQGQPPMPTPGKASPMAGLGGVDDRVSAYQGNTKPLEQRYAMSQDLLDLLALQKIKSQKDAAARQMQLQMAQQGAESGQANMTVAQQREQEVNDMTKNELAQQRGDTAQQQTQQQQDKIKQMMGGIAGAPGAAMAAQPKAMAAGGIVGYAGPQGSVVGEALRLTAEQIKKLYEVDPKLAAQARRGALTRAGLFAAAPAIAAEIIGGGGLIASNEAADTMRRMSPEQRAGFYQNPMVGAMSGDAGLAGAIMNAGDGEIEPSTMSYGEQMKRVGKSLFVDAPTAVAKTLVSAPGYGLNRDPTKEKIPAPAAVPPADKLPPANVVAAAQAAPKPPAPPAAPRLPGAAPAAPAAPGIAGLPTAPPSVELGAVGPANDFGTKLEAAALKNAQIDPAARQLDEEKRVEGRMALTPEQRKVYEEGIGGLQKMYQEQYDPERQRQEGIKRALIGAGGRRYGEFAGGAEAGMAYDDRMRAAKLKEFGDVQNARTGLIGIDRANVKGGIEAGQKAYEQSSMTQRQGADSGARMYGDDVKSRDTKYGTDVTSRDNIWKMSEESRNKVLDREIDKLKIAAQRDATAASRESLSYDKARTVYATTVGRAQELERKLDDDFSKQHGMLIMQEQSGKLDPAQKNQLETAKLLLQQQKAKLRKELEPVLESARQKLGVSSSDGFGEMKKVDSKK